MMSLCLFVLLAESLKSTESLGCDHLTANQSCSADCPSVCVDTDTCPYHCVQCKEGYFGSHCDRLCEGHCVHSNCELMRSGRALNCVDGCLPGWSGISCNTECKKACTECDRFTGECTGSCKNGYHGENCSLECPPECSLCNRHTGKCLSCGPTEDCSGQEFQEILVESKKGENTFVMQMDVDQH